MLKTLRRSFLPAVWLGCQVEWNWTDPFVFVVFAVLKPIAGVLILVFMYQAVAPAGGSAMYAYIYLGNAFYIYVGAVMAGTSYSILDDRERYRALKYLYIAPISIPIYLLGRAMARFVIATVAIVITIGAGVLLFRLPVNVLQARWLMFIAALALGVICMASMGVILGAWTLTVRSQPWYIGDAVAAALYLFSGAIFPITVLPSGLQPIGFALPMTYWLELLRRALLDSDASVFPAMARFSNAQLFAILVALTLGFMVLAFFAFGYFDRAAREKGMIDAQSDF